VFFIFTYDEIFEHSLDCPRQQSTSDGGNDTFDDLTWADLTN